MIKMLFDGSIFLNGLEKTGSRSGIYFTSISLFNEFINKSNMSVSIYLNTQHKKQIDQIKKSLKIPKRIVFLSETDNLSDFDIFFSPVYKIPEPVRKYDRILKFTVLYDTIPLIYPEYFEDSYWYTDLVASLNTNDYYFAISENTRSDFLKYCPQLKQEKVKTTLISTNFNYKPVNDPKKLKKIKKKYHIPENKKYVFSLCSLEPRKNLLRTVKTFIQFIKEEKIDDIVYVLGGGSWGEFIDKFQKDVSNYKEYTDKIIQAGYIDDKDLEILYSNAEWFVYTSQYEGFGMPPLEAMSCGCPVITSNNSSLPEVVGNDGIMINYDSEKEHIQAYKKYYFDLNFREKKAKAGLLKSHRYSWKSCANSMIDFMETNLEALKNTKNVPKDSDIKNVTSTKNNSLSNWDINMLTSKKYLYLPLDEVLYLGCKLENFSLKKEYFEALLKKRYQVQTVTQFPESYNNYKKIILLGIPLIRIKKSNFAFYFKMLGIPVLKIKNKPNKIKYYFLGIPILKVIKK